MPSFTEVELVATAKFNIGKTTISSTVSTDRTNENKINNPLSSCTFPYIYLVTACFSNINVNYLKI